MSAPKTDAAEPAQEREEDFAWVHAEIEAVIEFVRKVDSRRDILAALGVYMHVHHIVTSEARMMEIRAVCAIIGDVRPLIETMPSGDPIERVWIGYIDEQDDVLVHHPGWVDYCLKNGGGDSKVARTVREFAVSG